MKLFIARHGETVHNTKHLLSGSVEALLTENGHRQAKELAEKIMQNKDEYNIRTIFVSPLQRAKDTASYIEKNLGLKAIIDKRISEMNFGDMENTLWPSEEFLRIRANPFVNFPNGESMVQAAHRAYSLIEEIKEKYREEDGNILFVCHGLITVLMITYFKNLSQDEFYKTRIENCALLEFDLGV